MATWTACLYSPGSCSSSFSTTSKSCTRKKPNSTASTTSRSSKRLTAGATGLRARMALPATNCSPSSDRSSQCVPMAAPARACSLTCAAWLVKAKKAASAKSSPTSSKACRTAWSAATYCATSSTRSTAFISAPAKKSTLCRICMNRCCAKCVMRRGMPASSTPHALSSLHGAGHRPAPG